ncbi:ubiquinone biosynthesis protein [Arthrobacter subterraneus]|uniref:Ubiquinone biosynthesis protein n=1 Tax=Arthrobacter subterraneus TaxID=335973 RepID=A0A1G8CPI6_9MICC|nr:AarF/ABC1/UbiB kinase family protein [Arthrobacter subterraneus]AOY70817.1 ABC1 family protein [Arthrobacter sp. ZXY-2]SDH47244.1 ubiquinone biosynthesis protein [Arthrobacter subterraneus]
MVVSSHAGRYREIAEVLARHGLGFLAGITGLERWVPFHHGVLGHESRELSYTNPEHLRLALEQLGPTFIKLGQLLSTRSDLLPPEYLQELAKLQDGAPPVPGETVRRLIQQELGAGPEELFAEFESEPLASASIGQAHAALLADGTRVVVKVRRPGVVARVQEDLEILQNLAAQADRRWEAAADYNLAGLAGEFARTLRAELDYLQEGRNAERFAGNFAGNPGVHIPRVFWGTTTSRVLTLERISGVKVDDLEGLDRAGIDRRALANRAVGVIAQMIFEDGFFHADPHPGNLFIETGGRIGLIDFGMVGEVDEKLRGQLAVLLVALARADPERAGSALLDLSVAKRPVDRARLRADLTAVLALYQDRQLAEIDIAPLIGRLLALLREHHLQLPREIALILKMVLMAEGIGVRLDPAFNLTETLSPYAQRLALHSFSPSAYARRFGQAGLDAAELGVELPGKLRRILDLMDTDGFELHLRAAELEPLMERAERIGNRLVAGLIAAAFIRGVGELVVADKEEFRRWARALMGAGLGAGATLGSYLAWTARRKKR